MRVLWSVVLLQCIAASGCFQEPDDVEGSEDGQGSEDGAATGDASQDGGPTGDESGESPNVGGVWEGQAVCGTVVSDLSLTLYQVGSPEVTGEAVVPIWLLPVTGQVEATFDGETIEGVVVSGEIEIGFSGAVQGDQMVGTYDDPNGDCAPEPVGTFMAMR